MGKTFTSKSIVPAIVGSIALLIASCGGGVPTKNAPTADSDTMAIDSAIAEDSLDSVVESQPVPSAADEYFNDFMYSFTSNRKYQYSRIKFPLPVEQQGHLAYTIEKKQWHFTRMHMKDDIYLVFFDSKKSLMLEKSKDVSHVKIQWFFIKKNLVQDFVFQRLDSKWYLTKIQEYSLSTYEDEAFIRFYQRFASDTRYQTAHLASEIYFVTPNPDDEFEDLSGTIDATQWPTFRPELPKDVFTNIDYGQSKNYGNHRLVALEGSSNGFLTLLYFRREHGKWLLYHLEN